MGAMVPTMGAIMILVYPGRRGLSKRVRRLTSPPAVCASVAKQSFRRGDDRRNTGFSTTVSFCLDPSSYGTISAGTDHINHAFNLLTAQPHAIGIAVMTHHLTQRTNRGAVRHAGRDEPLHANDQLRISVWLPASSDQSSDRRLAQALDEVLVASGRPFELHPSSAADSRASAAETAMRYSVVLPVFNESENLPEVHRRLSVVMAALAEPYEIIYVDDGSRDESGTLLRTLQGSDPHVRVLRLSRNFGHQSAISAGIDHAVGDAVIVMDADLQDPPEAVPDLLAPWRQGHDVVYAIRQGRKENVLKRSAYGLFYRLLQQVANVEIPLDAGDFCVLDRRVADVLRQMPERNRFIRGIRSWVGFRQVGVPYNRAARFAGQPKYSLLKLLRLAFDGFFSFSYVPLRLASLFGLFVSFLGFLLSVWTVYKRFTLPEFPSGFATIVVGMMFLGGIQLIALGVIGEYVGRIFDEVKQRPLYIIGERWGFDD